MCGSDGALFHRTTGSVVMDGQSSTDNRTVNSALPECERGGRGRPRRPSFSDATIFSMTFEPADTDVEEAWAIEIQERVAAARAGELERTDWRTVLERVEREVLGR